MYKVSKSLREAANNLPQCPGVYCFENSTDEVIYVGKSINVNQRVASHLTASGTKSQNIAQESSNVYAIPVLSELEALLLEAELIKRYLPRYNSASRDDKHPLYIKITTSEGFPKVMTSRHEEDNSTKQSKKLRYFGPFQSSSNVKEVLRQVRKVFPYCSQRRIGKRGCFYSHIEFCNPCPNEIAHTTDLDIKERLTTQYKANVRKVVTLLSGKTKRLDKQLLGEMKEATLLQDFETAAQIRDQLRKINYVTRPYQKTQAYLENPNLVSDIREEEAKTLRAVLSPYFPLLPVLQRIECYDVAHTGGQATTCSMVTFVDGEPDKNYYRRFRIKKVKGVDDYAALREALTRRLAHIEDWGRPNLMVIDGGRGQVGTSMEVLSAQHIDIPVVGLAKRLEEIIIPVINGGFKSIVLGRGNPATKLLQRLRDEAHRFARSYHFKLRLRELLPQRS